MGQKVHPYIFRILQGKDWKSSWFASKRHYGQFLNEDIMIRKTIESYYKNAGISDIRIDRAAGKISITVTTSRPGVVIGRDGSSVDKLRGDLQIKLQSKDVDIKIEEVRKPDVVATLIAQNVVSQIERRIPYRRAVKQAIAKAIEAGASGCKIKVGGRLNGVEISRKETYIDGAIPLHTIRANVDYYSTPAHTTYGVIGVKVWVYHKDKELV
jgi:small subunit ribosomal protein S3